MTAANKGGRKPGHCSEQELAFVRALLENLTQTEAARRAGYAAKTELALATKGSRLVRQPKIAAELSRRRAILDSKSNMTREARLSLVEQMALDPKLEPRDRLKALELRAKMGGDFVERRQIENTGPAGGPVQIEVKLTTERAIAIARKGIESGPAQQQQPTPTVEGDPVAVASAGVESSRAADGSR